MTRDLVWCEEFPPHFPPSMRELFGRGSEGKFGSPVRWVWDTAEPVPAERRIVSVFLFLSSHLANLHMKMWLLVMYMGQYLSAQDGEMLWGRSPRKVLVGRYGRFVRPVYCRHLSMLVSCMTRYSIIYHAVKDQYWIDQVWTLLTLYAFGYILLLLVGLTLPWLRKKSVSLFLFSTLKKDKAHGNTFKIDG